MVTYPSGDEKVKGYLALPEGEGPHPAMIVIHEWWGLNEWVKEQAERLAQLGYVALAVDLYRGAVATDRDHAHELSRGLPEDRALRDLRAARDYLAGRDDVEETKVGVIGWCMGGGLSLQAALHVPGLSACVVAYGRLVTEQAALKAVGCPVLGIFGETDRGIPVESVRAFEAAMKELEKPVEIHVYEGVGHAFMNPGNRQGYSAAAADDAWRKIVSFLDGHLKAR